MNKLGNLSRPSIRQTKKPIFLTGIMALMLIVVSVFTMKMYAPSKNLLVTGGILIYPFTFLITAYIAKFYDCKEAKKSIITSTLLFALFTLMIGVCLFPASSSDTVSYNAIVQYVFSFNVKTVGNMNIFYPVWEQFFAVIVAFVASHMLFVFIYEAIYKFTNDYLAMGLSVFIASIVDRVIFVPILLLKNLIDKKNTFEFLVKILTSEFIATILFVMILIVLYVIISIFKAKKKTSA